MSEDKIERIPQHRHCRACGKAYTGDGDYCSEECENEKKNEIRKKKNILMIIWVLAVLMMIYAIFFLS